MRGRIIYTVGSRGEPVSPFVNLGSTGNSHYVPANQRWNVSAARRRFNNPACLLAGKGPIQDPRELLEQRHWAFVHIPGRTSRGQLPSLIRNKRELVPPLCFLPFFQWKKRKISFYSKQDWRTYCNSIWKYIFLIDVSTMQIFYYG